MKPNTNECSNAVIKSKHDYASAARILKTEFNKTFFSTWDQAYCRGVRGLVTSRNEHAVYHYVLKSMHSEALKRLNNVSDWLPAGYERSCVESPRTPELVAYWSALPKRFTIVRDPFSHMISGFLEVEHYWRTANSWNAVSTRRSGAWGGSRWWQCWQHTPTGGLTRPTCSTVERFRAMLGDMLAQSMPETALHMVAHMLPQTIGLLGPRKQLEIPHVIRAESSATDWAPLMRNLSISASTTNRRTNARSSVPPRSGMENISTSLVRADESLYKAVCLLTAREYSCLGYESPCVASERLSGQRPTTRSERAHLDARS